MVERMNEKQVEERLAAVTKVGTELAWLLAAVRPAVEEREALSDHFREFRVEQIHEVLARWQELRYPDAVRVDSSSHDPCCAAGDKVLTGVDFKPRHAVEDKPGQHVWQWGYSIGASDNATLSVGLPVDGRWYHWDVCRDGKKLTIHVEECG